MQLAVGALGRFVPVEAARECKIADTDRGYYCGDKADGIAHPYPLPILGNVPLPDIIARF